MSELPFDKGGILPPGPIEVTNETGRLKRVEKRCTCETPDWYHDGALSQVSGRFCRTCEGREWAIVGYTAKAIELKP